MASHSASKSAQDVRSVSDAGSALLRAVRTEGSDLDRAVERLELQARLAIDESVSGFDTATGAEPSNDALLAEALSQLSIGNTLLTAESALGSREEASRFESAVHALEETADALEAEESTTRALQGFDTAPGGVALGPHEAALAALDAMSAAATDVATTVLDKTLAPLVKRAPDDLRKLLTNLGSGVAGRLAAWGLRAVRRGLDLLLRAVDLKAIEHARDQIDQLLSRLGHGDDASAVAAWAIGADTVRARLAAGLLQARDGLVEELAKLSEGYGRLCRLLRRITGVVAGLGATMAILGVTVPHMAAVTTAGLVLILAAVLVAGRDYTGVTNLPGPVNGMLQLLTVDPNAAARP